MFKNLTKTLFGDPNEREAKRLQPLVDQINVLGPEFEQMTDDELRAQTDDFRDISPTGWRSAGGSCGRSRDLASRDRCREPGSAQG